MLRVPEKGSVEWVALSPHYTEVADKAEKIAAEMTDEAQRALMLDNVKKVRTVANNLKDVSIGVKNLGRKEVQKYSLEMKRLRMQEVSELVKLRKGLTKEQAPEYWESEDEFITPEGTEKAFALSARIIGEFVDGVRGVEGYKESEEDPQRIVDLFEHLGLSIQVNKLILAAQGLRLEETLS